MDDANAWAEGLFEIKRGDTGNIEKIAWQKFYFDKKQAAEIIKRMKNKAVFVNEENIIEEGKRRSSARNRSLNTSQMEASAAKTPAQPRSSKKSAKKGMF